MHRLRLGKPNHGDDGERQDRVALADQEKEPVHRRVPGWVEGHDPIDSANTHGDGIDQDAEAAQILQPHLPEAHVRMGVGIALQSPLVEQVHEDKPDREADRGLYPHAAHVQHGMLVSNRVRLLVSDQMLTVSLGGVAVLGPQVQLLHGEADGQKQHHDEGKAARHRLQRTAQQQAPLAAAHVLHHEQRKTAHGEAPAQDVPEQIGAQQVIDSVMIDGRRQHCEHNRQNSKDGADNHRPAPPLIEQQRSIQLRG